MADIARIIEIVEPEAKALGFDLVRVRYFKGGEIGPLSDAEEYTLQIMAERPDTGQLVIGIAPRFPTACPMRSTRWKKRAKC